MTTVPVAFNQSHNCKVFGFFHKPCSPFTSSDVQNSYPLFFYWQSLVSKEQLLEKVEHGSTQGSADSEYLPLVLLAMSPYQCQKC